MRGVYLALQKPPSTNKRGRLPVTRARRAARINLLESHSNNLGMNILHKSDDSVKLKNESYSKDVIKDFVKILNRYFPRKRIESLNKYSKFSRLFNQPGFAIAFLGTDGSGKSTIIEKNAIDNLYAIEH